MAELIVDFIFNVMCSIGKIRRFTSELLDSNYRAHRRNLIAKKLSFIDIDIIKIARSYQIVIHYNNGHRCTFTCVDVPGWADDIDTKLGGKNDRYGGA